MSLGLAICIAREFQVVPRPFLWLGETLGRQIQKNDIAHRLPQNPFMTIAQPLDRVCIRLAGKGFWGFFLGARFKALDSLILWPPQISFVLRP